MTDRTDTTCGLPRALLDPAAYPHAVEGPIRLIETHISWVLVAPPWAYKIKRPVVFDFLDFRAAADRRHFCEEELRLNRRLAPGLYRDVVPVTRDGHAVRVGGRGEVIDHAVRMVAFAPEQELQSLVEAGSVQAPELARLARDLVAFQAGSEAHHGGALGDPAGLRAAAAANFAALAGSAVAATHAATLAVLESWTRTTAAALAPLMSERRAEGRVRDGHGDLHAGNIVRWQGRLVPFDCIEFDPRLRCLDVVADVAFLLMDLQSRGRSDLAQAWLNEWLTVTGDFGALRLLPFHVLYYSMVRAKVDSLRLRECPGGQAAALRQRLEAHLQLARRWAQPSRRALVLMHGVSGSGKSWLAQRLAPLLPAVQLRADVERKRLAGLAPLERTGAAPGAGIYAGAFSERTYARLLDGAEAALAGAQHIIVDATFLDPARRAPFRALAARSGARLLVLHCEATPAVCADRVRARAVEATDPSEAGLEVLARQLRDAVPLAAAELAESFVVDTHDVDPAELARRIAAFATG